MPCAGMSIYACHIAMILLAVVMGSRYLLRFPITDNLHVYNEYEVCIHVFALQRYFNLDR